MLGAIIGDTVGSIYEFNNTKDYNFPLFTDRSRPTDDSIMTFAVAKWLIQDKEHRAESLVEIMLDLGRRYQDRGYGGGFRRWLSSANPQPYGSFGNGAGMRVSAVGLYAETLEEARSLARITASITHNHPEGIKGAESIAACVFLAREGKSKEEIKAYVEQEFNYDLSKSIAEIRPYYFFDETSQGTNPVAIRAFLEGNSFEEVLRLAIWVGGDSDTMAAMACAIAAAYYHIPHFFIENIYKRLEVEFLEIIRNFVSYDRNRTILEPFLIDWILNEKRVKEAHNQKYEAYYTPQFIRNLNSDEVFVFGSNLVGVHASGAARAAHKFFGATWGQGEGLSGQSYAIPTMFKSAEEIKPYILRFIKFARQNPQLKFFLTRIGTGIAGFSDGEISRLFCDYMEYWLSVPNIYLPKEFAEDLLCYDTHCGPGERWGEYIAGRQPLDIERITRVRLKGQEVDFKHKKKKPVFSNSRIQDKSFSAKIKGLFQKLFK